MNKRPLTKSRHLTCVAGNYLSLGPSGRRRGNYSSELSGQSELPFGRRQTVRRAGGLPRRSSLGPAGPLTCRRRNGARDALPNRRKFCVFWESAVKDKDGQKHPGLFAFEQSEGHNLTGYSVVEAPLATNKQGIRSAVSMLPAAGIVRRGSDDKLRLSMNVVDRQSGGKAHSTATLSEDGKLLTGKTSQLLVVDANGKRSSAKVEYEWVAWKFTR